MTALKAILLFVSFVILASLVFYGITVYDKHETRKQELNELEVQHSRAIDSLKVKAYADSLRYADLIAAKETEKVSRNNYAENKIKRDKEIYSNPVDVNRAYNDKFIYNFKPKYR